MKQILLGLVIGVTIIACIGATTIGTSVSSPWGGGSGTNGGGQILASAQFRTNSGIVYMKKGALQTNGAFWSDDTTWGLKAIGTANYDAFRQFELTSDGSTGYKLYGFGSLKWALNSDGTGSGSGLLTVGSLATTGAAGALWVTNSGVIVTNTATGDVVIITNGSITINGVAVVTNASSGAVGSTIEIWSGGAMTVGNGSGFYMGADPLTTPTSVETNFVLRIFQDCTIKSVTYHQTIIGTLGAPTDYQTNSISINGVVNTSTSVPVVTSSHSPQAGAALNLSIALHSNDVITVFTKSPGVWVTNAANIRLRALINLTIP